MPKKYVVRDRENDELITVTGGTEGRVTLSIEEYSDGDRSGDTGWFLRASKVLTHEEARALRDALMELVS